MRRRRTALTSTLAAIVTGAALMAGPAPSAAAGYGPETIASGLVGPLHFEVTRKGVLVSQSFAGKISRVAKDGTVTDVVVEKPAAEGGSVSVGGVASRGRTIAYLYASGLPGATPDAPETPVASQLKVREPDGDIRVLADLLKYEQENNPDARRSYGFVGLDAACKAEVAASGTASPEPYSGIVESNPYEISRAPGGGWYVADAAANTVLKVSSSGRIRTVYVGRPQPYEITAAAATMLGLPACTVGETYLFEPVPTDVEVTPSGHLLVTQLPGGPEDPSLGARGSLVKVAPWSGASWRMARGILGATNAAVGKHGSIYVTQLFANEVSRVRWDHRLRKVAELPTPAAVEYFGGHLYVATNVFPPEEGAPDGRIVRIPVR